MARPTYQIRYHSRYLPGMSRSHAQFQRKDGRLHLARIGRATRRGFPGTEWERVSDVFCYDEDDADTSLGIEDAMTAAADAWATHSGASVATLRTAIHEALDAAGFRAHDGTVLT